jgi:hypothetical protein
MIDEKSKQSLLDSISNFGTLESIKINTNKNQVLDFSSGKPRIQTSFRKKAVAIFGTPTILKGLSPFEIRCAICSKVISYPCWYHRVRYTVNDVHYFVCFDKDSPEKPSTSCYQK